MDDLVRRPNARIWLALVGTATIVICAIYGTAQQLNRLGANDAPRAAADTARENIINPRSVGNALPAYNVELSRDNSVFVIITDASGKIVQTNALLNGSLAPVPPKGVLDYAAKHGSDSVTWQPTATTRQAIYVEPFAKGFVIAGQSLKPFENRDEKMLTIAFAAWVLSIVWASLILWYLKPKHSRS